MKTIFQDKRILMIYILVIILIGLGFTYAISSANISLGLTTGIVRIDEKAYGNTEFDASNLDLVPILDSEVEKNEENVIKIDFTVGGASTNNNDNIIYDIALKDLEVNCDLLSPYVKWKLVKNGTKLSEGSLDYKFDTIDDNGRFLLTTIQQDLPKYDENETGYDNYNFYMWISDSCQDSDISNCTNVTDQSNLMKKTLDGKIEVELYTESKKELTRNPSSSAASSGCSNRYAVNYNLNGGTVSTSEKKYVISGSAFEELPTPTKTSTVTFDTDGGNNITNIKNDSSTSKNKIKLLADTSNKKTINYNFLGWYLEKNYTTKVDATTIVKTNENVNLYAKWEDAKVTLPSTTKEGSEFLGWYSDKNFKNKIGNPGDTYQIYNDTTVYAKWKKLNYTITYDSNGGSSCSPKTVANGSTYGSLCTPTKTGYVFYGWYTEIENGNQVTSNTIADSDITIYAHWNKITLVALKKTDTTSVESNVWSNEGLIFKINREKQDDNNTKVYYCVDENNSCTPNNLITFEQNISNYSSKNGTYYFRYFINSLGVTSNTYTYIAKVDDVVPEISIKEGTYEYGTSQVIQSTSFGPSGGTVSCINQSLDSEIVTNVSELSAIGYHIIKCTSSGNNGKTSIKTGTIAIKRTMNTNDSNGNLYVTGSGSKDSSGNIVLSNGGVQYGPYTKAVQGCYRVFYFGNNMNAYPSGFAAYDVNVAHFDIYDLNYVSSDANYYTKIPQNVSGLEFVLTNNSTNQITISKITAEPVACQNVYTIAFDGNGATSGSTSSKKCAYGSSCALNNNEYVKTGYNFAGWGTSANSGVVYNNLQWVSNLSSTDGATVTLYAQWTRNFSCASAGQTTSYAGYNWYTNSNDGSTCDLTLRTTSPSSGTYNEAYNKLVGDYFGSGTLLTEKNAGLITTIDSNGGLNGFDGGNAFWYASGWVYTPFADPQYGYSSTNLSWGERSSNREGVLGSNLPYEAKNIAVNTTSYYGPNALSLGNDQSTFPIPSGSYTVTKTLIASDNRTVFKSQGSGTSALFKYKVRQNDGSYNNYQAKIVNLYACGGDYHGKNTVTFTAKSSTAYKYVHHFSGTTDNARSYSDSKRTYWYAGTVSFSNKTGTFNANFSTGGSCLTYSIYSITDSSRAVYYRLHIKVKI